MKTKIIFIFSLFLFTFLIRVYADNMPTLLVFHSPSCHRCLEVKKDILPQIEKEFKDKIRIEYYDITDIKNYALMFGLKEKYKKDIALDLPVFFINGQLFNGRGDLKSNLKIAINVAIAESPRYESPREVNLLNHFKNFKPLAIAGAGLTDGINPCAFTVIVFFISYLALQGYKKIELILIGFSFIFAVFCTYLLIGLGIFNFIYRLEAFWIIAKIFNLCVGIFSLILGGLAIYDLLKFRKNHDAQGMLLQLPKTIKNRIHSVIGIYYRKNKDAETREPLFERLGKVVLSALITGFLISLLEAVCTGQLYLPTIAFILKTTTLKFKALIYLIIYNIMFILPLFIIFLLALFGVTSAQFAQFIRKRMVIIKALMSAMFIGLGIFLIWRG